MTDRKCFRCRILGHLPSDCHASTTTAGKPCVELVPNSKSGNLLRASDGRAFCFKWQLGSCTSGGACSYHHTCTLCHRQVMELSGAQSPRTDSDPCSVVTPYKPNKIEHCLRRLNLLDSWAHILEGLRHGFKVGTNAPISATIVFPNHASAELVRTRPSFTLLVMC